MLAAGAGSRWRGDGHKLLAPLPDGRSVVRAAAEAAVSSHIGPVIVVWGAVPLEAALDGLPVDVVHHPGWAEGQATTLAAGIAAARRLGADTVVVGLGDQPGVTAHSWRAVAGAPPSPPIAAASYDGVLRTPVRLPDEVWAALPTVGDEGARVVIKARPDLVQPVAVTGRPDDIDTTEDLEQWN